MNGLTGGGALQGSKSLGAVHMQFSNLTYEVTVKHSGCRSRKAEKKPILNNISGSFHPRTVTAIMGPSGAGKTTLLNVLAGRAGGAVSGSITVNGREVASSREWRKLITYMMQDDILLGTMTPREYLHFIADLRLPRSVSPESRRQRVESIIEELGLQKCADTRIGTPGLERGISGGERKRVSIALELITEPSILFLDEPTTGLDSVTAMNLIETLNTLAKRGRTIIMTIHQPSSEIFTKFDQLLLLAKGKIMYFGRAADSVDYFARLGYQCPDYVNPADYFMSLAAPKRTLSSTDNTKSPADVYDSYKKYETRDRSSTLSEPDFATVDQLILAYDATHKASSSEPTAGSASAGASDWPVPYVAPLVKQVAVLTRRGINNRLRDKFVIASLIAQNLALGVLIGLIYLQLGDDQASVQDRIGALYFITSNCSLIPMFNVLFAFPKEKVVFLREYASGSYSSIAYYIAKLLTDFPFETIQPMLFGTVVYFMIGFQMSAERFFIFIATMIVGSNVAQVMSLAVSAAVPSADLALIVTPMILMAGLLFSGLYINNSSVPPYFVWLYYSSFFRYLYEISLVNELSGLEFTCDKDEEVAGRCRIATGEDELKVLSMDEVSIGINFLAVGVMYAGMVILGCIFIRISAKRGK